MISGYSYWTTEEIMSRINDAILGCAIYLYETVADANAGEKSGGSGFVVGFPSEKVEGTYIYAVTNSHVIKEAKSPKIRINIIGDRTEVIDYDELMWHHHPNGDDIAVSPISITQGKHKLNWIPTSTFITEKIISDVKIGAGDEAFMVGRFIGYDGKQQNEPIVRFGNMAIGSVVKIPHPRGYLQESFLVETRSLSGFSGSPVFLYIPPFAHRPSKKAIESKSYGPWLLGVDWGHQNIYNKVLDKNGDEVPEGWKVKDNTGISNVIPVWKLSELLNIDELVKMRSENDDKEVKRMAEMRKPKESDISLDNQNDK